MHKSLFIILACISLISCQNYFIFEDNTTYLNSTINELTSVLSNYNWVSSISSQTWQFVDKGVWNGYINVKDFSVSNAQFNISPNSNSTFADGGVSLQANANSIQVVITFNYDARTGFNTYPTGTGTIILKTSGLTFVKKEFKTTEAGQTVSGSLTPNLAPTAALVTGGPIDSTLTGYFNNALQGNLANFIKSIGSDLTSAINNVYTAQSKSRQTAYNYETANPDINYTVSLNYLQDPTYEAKGVTYFFDGVVARKPNSTITGFLKEKKVNDSPVFDPTKGPFQIFLSYQVLKSTLLDISSSNNFVFSVNQGNLPTSTFQLTVLYLTQIVPGKIIFN